MGTLSADTESLSDLAPSCSLPLRLVDQPVEITLSRYESNVRSPDLLKQFGMSRLSTLPVVG
ncbi:hypothetical protein ACIBM3_22870 [Rhodococcus erythropolis]|uniref:hypothetical protein n=1 Tax=Rhodococcus erythropolis TaxID=1833 RepID=UPI0037B53333